MKLLEESINELKSEIFIFFLLNYLIPRIIDKYMNNELINVHGFICPTLISYDLIQNLSKVF